MSTIKTGSHISRDNSTFNSKNNKENKSDYYYKLPIGIVPLLLNLIFFTAILLIGLYTDNSRIEWNDAFLIAAYSSFSMNILWIVARQNFLEDIRYNIFSMWRKSFGSKIKSKISRTSIDFKNNINDNEEYKIFLEKRKDRSKTLFWVSLGIHFILLILSTIFIFVY